MNDKLDFLDFSFNWNRKLDCECFTSLRLSDRFAVGQWIMVTLKGVSRGRAVIVDKRRITVGQFNPFLCYLDTGYGVAETKAILTKMYPMQKISDNTPITLYLVRYETKKEKADREFAHNLRSQLELSV